MLCISRSMLVETRLQDGHVSWKVYLMVNLLPINCQITSESKHPWPASGGEQILFWPENAIAPGFSS